MRKFEAQKDSATTQAIRVALARRRETQGALARHLRLSQPAIHRRMAGKVVWRVSELYAIAEYLDVPVSDLIVDEKTSA